MDALELIGGIRLDPLEIAALIVLFGTWLGIGHLTERPPQGIPSVSVLMKRYRREWMRQFITRQPRIFDGNILSSLREGTAFFASACMIATGGLLALIGNAERLRGIAAELELDPTDHTGWQLRLLVTMFFVVNAFLKFVWAHRLFGYCAVMMAAVPNEPEDPTAMDRAMQAADLNITAARSFNAGLRSVYFALGSLGWLAGPWALFLGTAMVLFVTWRREFNSTSRKVILRSLPPPDLPDLARWPDPARQPRRR
ncbi:DUF599 domain-containing protein [Paracoccus sp. 1_MG-2023]|uniref:DUF599 domain-containing protein n=1 Tax=unclassified Paracoccus (in: a-proteobacteria) TaxID=2688777 RepID=UPI001C081A16|nr:MULTISPECIES: DUF599 domain-containing protein [unclassified Paracoccus (in: a-proteobacteria)]MBU2958406.1 DUF599 domain-containing protein [Paracoccus sp. C2R09]MDO6668609.1 DUF599 domain-containing protein [Paracoccus sp. 1_MG-2023]